MRTRNKRLKVYSITGALALLVVITSLNLSWKSVKEITKPQPILVDTLKSTTLQEDISFENYIHNIYEAAALSKAGLSFPVFEKAITGFYNLKSTKQLSNTKNVLTVVDFTLSSKSKRMWIIDVKNKNSLFKVKYLIQILF